MAGDTLDLSEDSVPAAHGTPDDLRMLARSEQLELLVQDGSVPGGRAHDGVEATIALFERFEEIDIDGIDGAQMGRGRGIRGQACHSNYLRLLLHFRTHVPAPQPLEERGEGRVPQYRSELASITRYQAHALDRDVVDHPLA